MTRFIYLISIVILVNLYIITNVILKQSILKKKKYIEISKSMYNNINNIINIDSIKNTKLIILYFIILEFIILSINIEKQKIEIWFNFLEITQENNYNQILVIFFLIIFLLNCLNLKYKLNNEELIFILLLGNLSIITIYTKDIFQFFLYYESISIIYYLLMCGGLSEKNPNMKVILQYIIYGIITGAMLLWGLTLLWGISGVMEFDSIRFYIFNTLENKNLSENILIQLSLFFIVISFLFKLAVYPFSNWIIPVYGAIKEHVFLFFVGYTNMYIYILYILKIYPLIKQYYLLENILTILGVLTIVIGLLKGFKQTNIISIIASSSLINIGFVFMLINYLSEEIITATYGYIILYNLLIILFLNNILKYKNISKIKNELFYKITAVLNKDSNISLFNKSNIKNIIQAICLMFIMGLPGPILIYKIYFIYILLKTNFLLTIIILLLNILGFVLYIKIIKNIFYNKNDVYKTSRKTFKIILQDNKLSDIGSFIFILISFLSIYYIYIIYIC